MKKCERVIKDNICCNKQSIRARGVCPRGAEIDRANEL